jgi:carbamoyl-phosphate synthase small subunit
MTEPTKSLLVGPGVYSDADACLALEDGRVFFGEGFGARLETDGEVVFNTSMTGYQEILTDPSYRGQMVVLTHPQIGNYGVQLEATESRCPWVTALIVRDLARTPNHWLAINGLDRYLADAGVPALQGIDTRALTRHLRTHGTMRAALGFGTAGEPLEALATRTLARARVATLLSEKNLVAEVCEPANVASRTERQITAVPVRNGPRIAVVDCGVKHNIARSLAAWGARVIPLPWEATIQAVVDANADGVVISNGPGDPERMQGAAGLVGELLQRGIPTLGICLGHQVFGLAAGGTTSRLRFGHHGGNHPVLDRMTGRVHITSQNHEFQVDASSIAERSGVIVSMVNLNDKSVEGLAHRELPAFSVQYHPEGCPGPQDNQYVFDRFLDMVTSPTSGVAALEKATR